MNKPMVWGWVMLATALVAACSSSGGTETDNPGTVRKFTSSACKTEASSSQSQPLLVETETQGLQCVEWSTTATGGLNLRLGNFPAPCGKAYLGRAAIAKDGALDLVVYKSTCEVYRCGTCVYDFDFELRNVDATRPLAVRVATATCATEPATLNDELTLPLDTEPSGATCRYLQSSALYQLSHAINACGTRNMPCGSCSSATDQSCSGDLVCTEIGELDSRCLAPCTQDSDCGSSVVNCQEGLCRASMSFTP